MDTLIKINITDYVKNSSSLMKKLDAMEKEDYNKKIGFVENPNGKIGFNCNIFSRFFLENVTVISQKNGNQLALYNYKKGVYELNTSDKIAKIIKYFFNKKEDLWRVSYERKAIISITRDVFLVAKEFNNGNYINLKDGILDLSSFKLKKHSPEYLSSVQLPFEYKVNVETPVFNKYLEDISCGDNEIKNILQEMTGYCLTNKTSAEKAFFLIGNGCNGKSVYAQLLQNLCGKGNYSNTSLSALGENFGLAQLVNSNVNISAENSSAKIKSEIFKAVVSGDTVEVNQKHSAAQSVKLHTKLVLLFNTLPESEDLTYGFLRRVLIIPFNLNLTKENIDVTLPEKLNEELPGIFHWAIEGLRRLQEKNYIFSESVACEKSLQIYKQTLNPVAEFFHQNYEIIENTKIRRSDIYINYDIYCRNNSIECISCQKFWDLLKADFANSEIPFIIKKIKGYEYIENISVKETFEEDLLNL